MKFVRALSAALLTLPGITTPASAQDGPQLYTLYCSACHGADGKGATGGTFPPLAGSPWVEGDADRAVKIVLKGISGPVDVLGKSYNLEMPPQGAVLPDDQIAAILTHVRSSWGNQAAAVSLDQVKTIREAVANRAEPWTAEEILKAHPLPLEKTALTNLISQGYSGKWSEIPNFSKLKAANIEEEHDGILSLRDSPFQDNFAMVWTADFTADADGDYHFLLDADDSATVIVDGKAVVAVKGSGPMNGSRVRTGKTKLARGKHPFRVEFLELSGQQGIALGWRGPGDKHWKWLTEDKAKAAKVRKPIIVAPENGRPVIYRNFIDGTTPRAIGVGFPGGLNLAYSADHLAPELIWAGKFIDGANKWIERGTDNNPPAGENVAKINQGKLFSDDARFRGYKLDPAGNPTFSVQIGNQFLLDSWHAESGALVRKLTLNGEGAVLSLPLASHGSEDEHVFKVDDNLFVRVDGAETRKLKTGHFISLTPGTSATLTYRWKP